MSTAAVAQFAVMTLLPVVASVLFWRLERRGLATRLGYWGWQTLVGALFGLIAVAGTEFGIATYDATMNVRDAAPLTAGLLFGGPAGIIAGIIGGVERWFAALWGRGMFTRVACSVATALSGFYALLLRRYIFDGKRASWPIALGAGAVAEVLHLLLILLTNIDRATYAFYVVRACVGPMMLCNALSVGLSAFVLARLESRRDAQGARPQPGVAQVIQGHLLAAVAVAFALTVGFTALLQTSLKESDTLILLNLNVTAVESEIDDSPEVNNQAIQSIVRNRYVGQDGILMVVDEAGNVMSTVDDLEHDIVVQLLDDASTAEEGSLFTTTIADEPYYALYYDSEGYRVIATLSKAEADLSRDVSVLVTSFIVVLVFAVLFATVYVVVRRVVVDGIWRVNGRLGEITRGDLDAQVDVRAPAEFASLSDDINATVAALKDAIAAESARIERDLATAKAIQESALPQAFPPFPEVDAFDLYASMNAAREVGGDFYDFFLVGEHTLGFLIADVSGKGIPASLFMMAAKTELANYMASGMDLAEAVATANYHLCQGNEAGMFVTVWAALLDYETGKLTYVNAGHNPPLLRHGGQWMWLREKGGLFLGTFDSAKYRSHTLTLAKGDELLLYTDGVNEAFSAEEEQFGDDRLEAWLSTHADQHPRALVEGLRGELAAWEAGAEQSDDITMLALEFGVAPEVHGEITVSATLDHVGEVLDFVHAELGQRLCPLRTQNQIDIAVEELFVNVCNYAYADADEPGECTVSYLFRANPNVICISLTDTGVPFDPLEHIEPTKPQSLDEVSIGGLGIYITKRNVDDLSYLRDGDRNVVAFTKGW